MIFHLTKENSLNWSGTLHNYGMQRALDFDMILFQNTLWLLEPSRFQRTGISKKHLDIVYDTIYNTYN